MYTNNLVGIYLSTFILRHYITCYDVKCKQHYVTGYQCEEHNNPADFFLDVVNGDTHKHIDDVTKTNDNVTKDKNDDVTKEEKYDITKGRELVTKSSEDFVRIARELNGKYLNSDARKRLEKEFEVIGEVMEGLL